MQVLLLAHVLEELDPLSCQGCVKPLEEVGNYIFVTKDSPGLSLDGAKHPSEVPRGQGPLLANDKGPEINFWPFPRGSV